MQPRVPVQGNKASKPLIEKNLWGLWCQGKLLGSQEFVGDPQGPRMYTNPPTWESAQERPNLLVVSGGSD